jgi:tetratricopeptide (TPR) repeat protein
MTSLKRFLMLAMLLASVNMYAQDPESNKRFDNFFDSTVKNLAQYPHQDSARLTSLEDIVYNPYLFYLRQKKLILPYCTDFRNLARNLHDKRRLGSAYQWFGYYYKTCQQLDSAVAYLDSAIELCTGATDKQLISRRLSANLTKGYICNIQEKYSQALQCFFEVLKHTTKASLINQMNANIGSIYAKQKNYDKAEEYFSRLDPIDEKNRTDQFMNYCDYADLLNRRQKYGEALQKLRAQSSYTEGVNFITLADYYKNYGIALYYTGKSDSAVLFFDQALVELQPYPHPVEIAEVFAYKSKICTERGDYKSAMTYLDTSLASLATDEDNEVKILALQTYSRLYEKIGEYSKAYTYLQESLVLTDALIREDIVKYNASLSEVYQNEKLKQDALQSSFLNAKIQDSMQLLQAITSTKLLKEQFLSRSQHQSILLKSNEVRINQQLVLTKEQRISILNKDKQLQHLEYLQAMAELHATEVAKTEKEGELKLTQKQQQLEAAKVKTLSQKNENNILRRKQIVGYGLAAVSLLLFGMYYWFNRNRNKQLALNAALAQDKAAQEVTIAQQQTKEAELQRNLSEVSLSALRSQMNPHFIFNSLNSINSVVIEGNTPLASDYLTKFSKLIRMILDNSKSTRISLATELEVLRLYVLMEKIRFHEKFDYEIVVDDAVNCDAVLIPPTILQPFIENAILHGLMPLQTGGKLTVAIKQANTKHIEICISDNGVGRQKSAELRSSTAGHKSHGLEITLQRLTELNASNTVEIFDKVDGTWQPTGTTVVINLYV